MEYGTNQLQLKQDTSAKCKKTRVTRVYMQKSSFACIITESMDIQLLNHCQ